MFGLIPFPYNILAAIAAVLALVAGVYFGWEHYVANPYRDEGRAEVRAQWDAANNAQKVREAKAAAEAEEFAQRLEAKRGNDFNALARRNAELSARLAAVPVGPVLVDSLRDAVRTANNEGARTPAESPAAITGLDVAEWGADVAKLYRSCREQVIGWIAWDDARFAN